MTRSDPNKTYPQEDSFVITKSCHSSSFVTTISYDHLGRIQATSKPRKHRIDLADCEVIFDAPMVTVEDDREAYGEHRLQSLGLFHGVIVLMVWVDRSEAPMLFPSERHVNMKNTDIGKPLGTDLEELKSLSDEAIITDDVRYDPNDPEAVEAFWRNAKVTPPRRPGERGKQKAPTKAQITLRLSPEVIAYFKAQGSGWQTRIDEALKEWIAERR